MLPTRAVNIFIFGNIYITKERKPKDHSTETLAELHVLINTTISFQILIPTFFCSGELKMDDLAYKFHALRGNS